MFYPFHKAFMSVITYDAHNWLVDNFSLEKHPNSKLLQIKPTDHYRSVGLCHILSRAQLRCNLYYYSLHYMYIIICVCTKIPYCNEVSENVDFSYQTLLTCAAIFLNYLWMWNIVHSKMWTYNKLNIFFIVKVWA